MAQKLPMKKVPAKKKFTGFMLPLTLTAKIRALAKGRNRSEKKAGSRLTTQSDIVVEALRAHL
jgi:hypothetical protein